MAPAVQPVKGNYQLRGDLMTDRDLLDEVTQLLRDLDQARLSEAAAADSLRRKEPPILSRVRQALEQREYPGLGDGAGLEGINKRRTEG